MEDDQLFLNSEAAFKIGRGILVTCMGGISGCVTGTVGGAVAGFAVAGPAGAVIGYTWGAFGGSAIGFLIGKKADDTMRCREND